MTHTCSIIIRKNTPEIRRMFEELGYSCQGKSGDIIVAWSHLSAFAGIWSDGRNKYALLHHKPFDCDTNEELVFALAALRDDTDAGQWFVR